MSIASLLPEAVPADRHLPETEDRLQRFSQFRHIGMRRVEICRLMGVSGETHDRWLEMPYVQACLDQLAVKQETHVLLIKDRLRMEALELVTELCAMSRDATVPAAVRANIKQDLLDREGTAPKRSHVEASGERKIFSDDQFAKLMSGMVESARRGNADGSPPEPLQQLDEEPRPSN